MKKFKSLGSNLILCVMIATLLGFFAFPAFTQMIGGSTFSGGTVPDATTFSSLVTFSSGATVSSGQLLLPDGSVGAPSLALASNPDTGIYSAGGQLGLSQDGSVKLYLSGGGVEINGSINTNSYLSLSANTLLYSDAANTLALKNGNAEQQFNIYSGNGAYGLIRSKQELVTTTAAATALTAADFIPDGAVVLAVSTYVQTAITVASLTGYNIGDGADADRWGAITGHAVGTKSNNADWTATTLQGFIAAQAITLTAVGANFPAGGKIRVCITYISNSEPTS